MGDNRMMTYPDDPPIDPDPPCHGHGAACEREDCDVCAREMAQREEADFELTEQWHATWPTLRAMLLVNEEGAANT